ncbi:MAG TPA: NAD(P)-dependent alcohol dehydrogenase [Novosphingobium sp.]|nr:NAD(P)-dependent alcohol dehydrogenase [Novosphingobium sp.]
MTRAKAYAAHQSNSPLAPWEFERRSLRENDVLIDILYCGVCHSDLHAIHDHSGMGTFPLVPGHEIVGKVREIGPAVTKVAVGDNVAVGCMVDSCMACDRCEDHLEHYCRKGATMTYRGRDRITREPTQGGYSDHIVVREDFVLSVPDGLDLERAGPLLCAGITTWSPLKLWKAGPGTKVAVAGLGGLGHMAVKLAVGLGADVTVITTSPSKVDDALALGASRVLLSSDPAAMKEARSSFNLIIDTVPVPHDLNPYLSLLDLDGTIVLVGVIQPLPEVDARVLIMGRRSVAGSMIGGIAETQELLEFCAEKNILPDCETIAVQDINHAFERMDRNDVKYRFVIDMATLQSEPAA